MPPQIPRIAPEVQGVSLPPAPSVDPASLAATSTLGARTIAKELGGLATQVEDVYAREQRAKRVLQNEEDRFAASSAIDQFKLAVGRNELAVRGDMRIPASEHAARIEALNQKSRQDLGKGLKTERSRLLYERGAGAAQATAAINAQAEALKTRIAGLKVEAAEERQRLENEAVFGLSDTARAEAKAAIEQRIVNYGPQGTGIYSAEEVIAARKGSEARVAEGEIRRDVRTPETRIQTMDRLARGDFAALPPDKQLELHATFVAEDERDRDREAREQYQADKAQALSGAYKDATNKVLTEEQYQMFVTRWQLTPAEQKNLRDAMATDDKEAPSDPATLDRIEPKVYSMAPSVTETELNRLREARLLNRKDHVRLLEKLDERRKWHLEHGRSDNRYLHTRAEQEIKAALGIPDIFDKLEPTKEKAWALFSRELNRRSAAAEGAENPLKVAADIIPRAQQMLASDARITEDDILKVLKYPNETALNAAAEAGEIRGSDLDNQRRLFIDLGRVRKDQRFNLDLKGASRATQQLGGGGTTPGSGRGTAGKPPAPN
jgi:hypothetical protein